MVSSYILTLSLSAAAFFAAPAAGAEWWATFYSGTGCQGKKEGKDVNIVKDGCLTGPSGSVGFHSSTGGNDGNYALLVQDLGCGCYTNYTRFDTWNFDDSDNCIDLDGGMDGPSYRFEQLLGPEAEEHPDEYTGDTEKC